MPKTFEEFAKLPNISASYSQQDRRYDQDSDEWPAGSTHWRIIIRWKDNPNRADKQIRSHALEYSMGSAHKGKPKLADVLCSLQMDVSSAVNAGDFEDWASDLGYDTDSRKAEQIYRACLKSADDLAELFGESWETFLALEEDY